MNKLSNYTKDLFADIRIDFKKVMRSGKRNNLHHFRVDLKKLFALLEIIDYCYPEQKTHFKKLYKLFKHAGEIRELQLLYADLKTNVKIKNKYFDSLLKEIIKNEKTEFYQFKKKYLEQASTFFNKAEHRISSTLKTRSMHTFEEYLLLKQKRILSLLIQISIDPKQIHDFRKEVKSVNYNIQVIKTINSSTIINSATLKDWDKQLGLWHDKIQILKNLKRLSTGESKSDLFRKQVHVLINNYSKKEQVLFEEIINKFDIQIKQIVKVIK